MVKQHPNTGRSHLSLVLLAYRTAGIPINSTSTTRAHRQSELLSGAACEDQFVVALSRRARAKNSDEFCGKCGIGTGQCDGECVWKPRFSATMMKFTVLGCHDVEPIRLRACGCQLYALRWASRPAWGVSAHWSNSIAPTETTWLSLTLFTVSKV